MKQAEQFDSDIEISLNGKSADAKRLFSVMVWVRRKTMKFRLRLRVLMKKKPKWKF